MVAFQISRGVQTKGATEHNELEYSSTKKTPDIFLILPKRSRDNLQHILLKNADTVKQTTKHNEHKYNSN